MKRRTYLGAIGALGSGSVFAVGSGAFSFTRAERDLKVAVIHDNDAYLELRQRGSGGRAIEDETPEQVIFELPGFREESPGDGLGKNSVYEFDRDANEDSSGIDGLLKIANRGTNTVVVYSEHDGTGLEIELYDVTDPDKTALRTDPPELGIGESIIVGLRIETFETQVGTHEETLEIIAEEPE